MTCRFVVNTLLRCATLLSNNFGKEKIYETILGFIVYFNKKMSKYHFTWVTNECIFVKHKVLIHANKCSRETHFDSFNFKLNFNIIKHVRWGFFSEFLNMFKFIVVHIFVKAIVFDFLSFNFITNKHIILKKSKNIWNLKGHCHNFGPILFFCFYHLQCLRNAFK